MYRETKEQDLTELYRIEMLQAIGEATGEDLEKLEALQLKDLSEAVVDTSREVQLDRERYLGADEIDPKMKELRDSLSSRKRWTTIAAEFDK